MLLRLTAAAPAPKLGKPLNGGQPWFGKARPAEEVRPCCLLLQRLVGRCSLGGRRFVIQARRQGEHLGCYLNNSPYFASPSLLQRCVLAVCGSLSRVDSRSHTSLIVRAASHLPCLQPPVWQALPAEEVGPGAILLWSPCGSVSCALVKLGLVSPQSRDGRTGCVKASILV